MANEMKHGSVGTELTQAEWEGIGTHVLDSQATGDLIYASSSSQLRRLAVGTNTHVLVLDSGVPAWSSSTGITALGTIATGVWQGTDVGVAYGGTGVSTLTDGGVLLGSGTNAITAMAVLTDGQMIVGNGSTDPVAESGATLRTSIGVGTGDSPQFTDLTLTDDLVLNSDSAVFSMGDGADFSITHDGTTGATLAGNPITITSAGAATWSTSSGALTLTSAAAATWSTSAGVLTIDGDDGIKLQTTGSGNVEVGEVLDITDSTDSSDDTGDTGALRTEGGASVAKKLYVGSDADITGTLTLDGIAAFGASTSATRQVYISSALETHDSNMLYADRSYTDATNNSIQGIKVAQQRGRITAAFTGSSKGMYIVSQVADGNRQAWSRTTGGLVGVDVLLGSGGANATGAIATAYGYTSSITMGGYGANATATDYVGFKDSALGNGTSTNRYGFYAADTGGTVTTQYGLYVENLDGATNGYGVYIAGADTAGIYTEAQIRIGADATNNAFDNATNGSGAATMYIGNTSITTSSDMRLKTDVEDTKINAVDTLNQMRVVDFGWDDPTDTSPHGRNYRGRYTGMLAQETVKVAPWIINDQGGGRDCEDCMAGRECDQHGMFHVEYQHLVPMLVKAIQELKEELSEVRNVN